jgi:hypothetical protein
VIVHISLSSEGVVVSRSVGSEGVTVSKSVCSGVGVYRPEAVKEWLCFNYWAAKKRLSVSVAA